MSFLTAVLPRIPRYGPSATLCEHASRFSRSTWRALLAGRSRRVGWLSLERRPEEGLDPPERQLRDPDGTVAAAVEVGGGAYRAGNAPFLPPPPLMDCRPSLVLGTAAARCGTKTGTTFFLASLLGTFSALQHCEYCSVGACTPKLGGDAPRLRGLKSRLLSSFPSYSSPPS